ncbi:hypothetical protein V6N13_146627 [Hibiscus sabdariffa]
MHPSFSYLYCIIRIPEIRVKQRLKLIGGAKKREAKMIYRTWSLLTGPVAIIGGVVGATVVAHLLFVDDPYLKPKKKNDSPPPRK